VNAIANSDNTNVRCITVCHSNCLASYSDALVKVFICKIYKPLYDILIQFLPICNALDCRIFAVVTIVGSIDLN